MNALFDSKDLLTNEWLRLRREENRKPEISYDKHRDVLNFYMVPIRNKERILTYYIDRYAAILFRAEDHEVIGICFEGFCRSFFPAHINKQWNLKDTSVSLNGIRDLAIRIQAIEELKPAPHYIIPEPFAKNISIEPVYA